MFFFRFKKLVAPLNLSVDKLDTVKSYQSLTEQCLESTYSLQQTTWQDINLDAFCLKYLKCYSTLGQLQFIQRLKTPYKKAVDIHKFQTKINALSSDIKALKRAIFSIGTTHVDLKEQLDLTKAENGARFYGFWFLRLLMMVSIGSLVFGMSSNITIYALIIMWLINTFVHYYISRRIGEQIKAMAYIVKIVRQTPNIIKGLPDEFIAEKLHMSKLHKLIQPITRLSGVFFVQEGDNFIIDYVNVIFLVKEIAYYRSSRFLKEHDVDVIELAKLIGDIDVYVTIADLLAKKTVCTAQVDDNFSGFEGTIIYHPLIDNPVANDVKAKVSMLITGSNMSGKSTFLRTVALSVLSSQVFGIAFAESFKCQPVNLLTCISLNDDIFYGKSYYLVEAEAVKQMINYKEMPRGLFIIDEIFKGTNPEERIPAAIETLNYFNRAGHLTLVATHDSVIVGELIGYMPYYFTENVTKEQLSFSYKLREGNNASKNAIKILEYLDYPQDLITKINQRIKH